MNYYGSHTPTYEKARSLGFWVLAGLGWGASITVGLFTLIFFFAFIFSPESPGWGWSVLIGPVGTAATVGLWMLALMAMDET